MKYCLHSLLALLLIFIFVQSSSAQLQGGTPWTNLPLNSYTVNEDALIFLNEAEVAWSMGNIDRAVQSYNRAVEFDPESPFALIQRAKIMRTLGMNIEATRDIERAVQLNPYATYLYDYNGPQSALGLMAFEPSAAVMPVDDQQRLYYYYRWVDNQRAADLETEMLLEVIEETSEGQFDEAGDLIQSFVQTYPGSSIGWDVKGMIHLQKGELDAAKVALQKAIRLQPEFAIAWYNLARIERQLGNLALASTYLDKAIQLESTLTKAMLERALLRKQTGNESGAINDYNRVIELAGDRYIQVYLNRGLTRKMLGDFTGALEDMNLAIKGQPGNALLLKNRGNLYFLFGHYKQAIADYTDALDIDNNLAEAYFNRALVHLKTHDTDRACEDFIASEALGYPQAQEKRIYFCGE